MENHEATINTPPSKPSKPAPIVRPAGEDWAVIDQVTGKLTLQPGRANSVIFPETGKVQEYRHLIKGTEKSNVESVRQWLLIGKVDNIVIELWLFTCTVAGYPLGQKTWGHYVPHGMWKWVFVPLNGSVGPLDW